MARERMNCLPKMSEREARKGWKMLDVRRYDVPAQKVSLAVPWMAEAMAFYDSLLVE